MKKISLLMLVGMVGLFVLSGCQKASEPATEGSTNAPAATNAPASTNK